MQASLGAPAVRPAVAEDVPAIARLIAGSPLWQRYGVTEAAAAERLRLGLENGATIAVAECGGDLAGFVWYVQRGAFQRSGYIMLFGVAATYQGQGVGRLLLEYAESALFEQAGTIMLLVSDFNQAAQAFYRKYGYQQAGAIPDYVIPTVSELIFYKHKDHL